MKITDVRKVLQVESGVYQVLQMNKICLLRAGHNGQRPVTSDPLEAEAGDPKFNASLRYRVTLKPVLRQPGETLSPKLKRGLGCCSVVERLPTIPQ